MVTTVAIELYTGTLLPFMSAFGGKRKLAFSPLKYQHDLRGVCVIDANIFLMGCSGLLQPPQRPENHHQENDAADNSYQSAKAHQAHACLLREAMQFLRGTRNLALDAITAGP